MKLVRVALLLSVRRRLPLHPVAVAVRLQEVPVRSAVPVSGKRRRAPALEGPDAEEVGLSRARFLDAEGALDRGAEELASLDSEGALDARWRNSYPSRARRPGLLGWFSV